MCSVSVFFFTWGAYLQKQGYKRRMVEADFSREYPRGVYVLGYSGHVLTMIDGAWWKNNSFTTAALQADQAYDKLKAQGK